MDFEEKNNALFAMAAEVALLGADVYVTVFTSDGEKAFTFDSTERSDSDISEPEIREQAPVETNDIAELFSELELVDEDISSMNLDELIELEAKLKEKLSRINDRKVQISADPRVQEVEGCVPPTRTESSAQPEVRAFVPSPGPPIRKPKVIFTMPPRRT